ncbi:MAG TPA: hypothetical protein VHE60_15405 [Pyrinomonadaceae bacterium]|nr:hypothetical protein [Pyrinomonadaceae bacterium]
MRKLLSNTVVMLSAASIVATLGLAISIRMRDFSWLQRCGSVVTCVGILLLTRPSITGNDILERVVMDKSGLTDLDPEYYRRQNEPLPDLLIEDRESRRAVGIFGPVLTVFGSLIWGFAELLNSPLGFRR